MIELELDCLVRDVVLDGPGGRDIVKNEFGHELRLKPGYCAIFTESFPIRSGVYGQSLRYFFPHQFPFFIATSRPVIRVPLSYCTNYSQHMAYVRSGK